MSTAFGQCPICQDLFTGHISALICGHTFHHQCILQWMERSKTCPQCRVRCTNKQVVPHLFFDQSSSNANSTQYPDSTAQNDQLPRLVNKVSELEARTIADKKVLSSVQLSLANCKEEAKKLGAQVDKMKELLRSRDAQMHAIKVQNANRRDLAAENDRLSLNLAETNKKLKKVQSYERLLTNIDMSGTEVVDAISEFDNADVKSMIVAVKRAYDENKKERKRLVEQSQGYRMKNEKLTTENRQLRGVVSALKEEVRTCSKGTPFNPKLSKFIRDSPMDVMDISLTNNESQSDNSLLDVTPYSNRTSNKPKCDSSEPIFEPLQLFGGRSSMKVSSKVNGATTLSNAVGGPSLPPLKRPAPSNKPKSIINYFMQPPIKKKTPNLTLIKKEEFIILE